MKTTKAAQILDVLRDGRWHDGGEFLNGQHGFFCSSYSQRISQLIAQGHVISRKGSGGHGLGLYRLLFECLPVTTPASRPAERQALQCEGCPSDGCCTCHDAPHVEPGEPQPALFGEDTSR